MELRSVASSCGFVLTCIIGLAPEAQRPATPEFIITLINQLGIRPNFHVQICIHIERFRNIFIAFHFFYYEEEFYSSTVLKFPQAKLIF
jgi:hypothetical protein